MARRGGRFSPPSTSVSPPRLGPYPARVMAIGRPVTLRRPAIVRNLTYGEVVRARARHTRLDFARVKPQVVEAFVSNRGRLLGVPIGSPKQAKVKRLCKCHGERSNDQRAASRAFFSKFGARRSGGGAARRKVHACQC